jgi:hypothetical protein
MLYVTVNPICIHEYVYSCGTCFTYRPRTSLHVRTRRSEIGSTAGNEVLNKLKSAPTQSWWLHQFTSTRNMELVPHDPLRYVIFTHFETTNSTEQSFYWEVVSFTGAQEIAFYKSKVQLLHSSRYATRPYPEPDESNPHPHEILLRTMLIKSSDLPLGLPSGVYH